ncbi:MAG: ankyrin repeat domain-containing protein [Chloroflexi bacterium]|nr:ankyrin repeat domain-containing protein [Chloroflexota bacterium]
MLFRKQLSPDQLLINAIVAQDGQTVTRLLDAQANPNAVDRAGIPALVIALSAGWTLGVQALLRHGAKHSIRVTDPRNNFNNSPVTNFPASNGSTECMALLLDAGADVTAADATGLNALMSAAYMGHADMVNLLLAYHTPLEARDESGYTALMFACNAGHVNAVQLLLNAGADVNASANDGSTPIMFAAQHGHDKVVHLLLDAGADAFRRGSHGLSALGFAEQNEHHSTQRLIQSANKRR